MLSEDDAAPDEAYEPPTITTLGTLADITRGGDAIPTDGINGTEPIGSIP